MNIKKNIQKISTVNESKTYDVCIIGSGPAGTTLGKSLVEKGINTIILESGTGTFQWLFDSKVKDLASYELSGNTNYPLTKTKARLLGGNSNFWTGRCERFHPSDFEKHPYTPPENPWPISYQELAPFYEKAEQLLRVRGGPRSQFAPPRDHPLPLPAKPDIWYLKSLMSRAGLEMDDTPTATPTKGYRFFKVNKELLPDFLLSPYGTLAVGATVTQLIANEKGLIIGAEVRSLEGEKKEIHARSFVIACGGMETPRLLMLSKSKMFPQGIGNSHDMVGIGFNEHPGVNFYARIPHELGTIQPTNKVGRSHQLYSLYRDEGLGSIVPVVRQSWILPHHTMPFKLSRVPRNVLSMLTRLVKATLYIGVNIEQKISESNRVTLSESKYDLYGNPIAKLQLSLEEEDLKLLDRCRQLTRSLFDKIGASDIFESDVTWSRHHQGTCRMGNNPKTSVVDKNLRVHESPNLYVCGSEVFVTGGAMQPCLSIVAFAARLAEHLAITLKHE